MPKARACLVKPDGLGQPEGHGNEDGKRSSIKSRKPTEYALKTPRTKESRQKLNCRVPAQPLRRSARLHRSTGEESKRSQEPTSSPVQTTEPSLYKKQFPRGK